MGGALRGGRLEGNDTGGAEIPAQGGGLPGLIGTCLKMMLETLPKASKEEAILGRALQA